MISNEVLSVFVSLSNTKQQNEARGIDTVEAHSCVDNSEFTDEQYATINQSTAGRFDPRVFVNCLQPSGPNILQLID